MMPDARAAAWTFELATYIRKAALLRGVEIVPYPDGDGFPGPDIIWLVNPDDATNEWRMQFGLGDLVKEVRILGDQPQMSVITEIQNAITDLLQADQGRQADLAELQRLAGL